VRNVIAPCENTTEGEESADIEATCEEQGITMMAIPTELVPKVQAFRAQVENG
jgi:hypothetical protein